MKINFNTCKYLTPPSLLKGRNDYSNQHTSKVSDERAFMSSIKLENVQGISFGTRAAKPVFAIDYNGKSTYFPNKKEASSKLEIDLKKITCFMANKLNWLEGYIFVYEESIPDDGFSAEHELSSEQIEKIRNTYRGMHSKSLYAVAQDGTYKKFDTQLQCSKEYWSTNKTYNISECLNGLLSAYDGYGFVYSSDIEDFVDGKFVLNEEKMKKFADTVRDAVREQEFQKEFYAFDKDKNHYKFSRIVDAANELDVDASCISGCLVNPDIVYSAKGYVFIPAVDVVIGENENKDVIFDEKLIDKYLKRAVKKKPVSAYKNGRLIGTYESRMEAAKKLKMSVSDVSLCAAGKIANAKGYIFIDPV